MVIFIEFFFFWDFFVLFCMINRKKFCIIIIVFGMVFDAYVEKYFPFPVVKSFFCRDPTPLEIFMEPSLALKTVDYSKCELCHFTVRNEMNDSSPDDLMISSAIGIIKNENFFSRSIRTVQSKCHIVIICDEVAINNLPKERYESTVKCGVQFCVVPTKTWEGGYWGQASAAYYYILAYLLRNRGLFKRVIFQDLFDSVFQGDPFTSDLILSENEIHVTHEFKRGKDGFMKKYYKEMNIVQPCRHRRKYFINSSHFGGFAETILRFLLAYVSVMSFKDGWNDQTTINYLSFSGILKSHGISFSDDSRPQRFINLISGRPVEKAKYGDFHAHFSKNSYAVSIHQIYMSRDIMANIVEYCPIKERNETLIKDYFSKCDDICIERIMKYLHEIDNHQ